MAAAFLLWPYCSFLSSARTWLVSTILTGLFLILLFSTYFLKIKMVWRLLAGFIAGAVFLWGAFHFADKGGLKTLTTPMEVIKGYNEVKILIKQKESSFHSPRLRTQLYNAEENDQERLSNMTSDYKQYPLIKPTQTQQSHEPSYHNQGSSQGNRGSSQENQEPPHRDIDVAYNNIFFRLLIWEDMMRELWESKRIFGVGLAHPQRSRDIEILDWASGEWSRDGWITPHNSFLHLIYRAGIIGIGVIGVVFIILYRLIKDFIDRRSVVGVLLSGIIINGLIAANFLLVLELPYYAIPFWIIFGMTMAYRRELLENEK